MPFYLNVLFLVTLTACAARTTPPMQTDAAPVGSDLTTTTDVVAMANESAPAPAAATPVAAVPRPKPVLTPALKKWCDTTENSFKKYGWPKSRCEEFHWTHVRNSAGGHAIPWLVFGEESDLLGKNVTLIMCGVHGDEITPVKFCYDVIYDLNDFKWDFTNRVVIVAPLVSPDSFFKPRPTRTNGRGVDVNRNFPTKDWNSQALSLWKKKYRKDKRRFPGHKALSEQETIFQINLIKRYQPSKIISVHSPLGLLDYDGPVPKKRTSPTAAKDLLVTMSEKAAGYKVSNYPYFPGSLGNWAGNELGIPTYTLELPTIDSRKSEQYWKLFRGAIHHAIEQTIVLMPEDLTGDKSSSHQHD